MLNQEEINAELDHFLEQGIFNCDITEYSDAALIREYCCSAVQAVHGVEVTDEQWLNYAAHCLQVTMEKKLSARGESSQAS